MGKQQIHFEFEEYIWRQFQELYPRQARSIFEDIMKSMINFKLEVTDEEGEQLKNKRDQIQKQADVILSDLHHYDMKLKIWEANKRKQLLEEKHQDNLKDDEASSIIQSLKASGVLAK